MAAYNEAIKRDGTTENTVKLVNSAQGKNQLVITLKEDNKANLSLRHLLRMFDLGGGYTILNNKTDFSILSINGFQNIDEFVEYLKANPNFVIDGCEISTSDTDNFINGNGFVMTQKYITGKESEPIDIYFEDYKVDNGAGGYNKTLKIPSSDFSPVVTGLFSLGLKSLKKNTSMTFKFNVPLQQQTFDASPIEVSKI